jgi:hypothetical protein
MTPPSIPAQQWWGNRRFRYNIGLIVAGVLAFAAQAAVVSWGIPKGRVPRDADPDAVLARVIADAVSYVFLIGVANLCYFLGPFSEKFIKPVDYGRYRSIAFRLGFWFSVLLPFTVPLKSYLQL